MREYENEDKTGKSEMQGRREEENKEAGRTRKRRWTIGREKTKLSKSNGKLM